MIELTDEYMAAAKKFKKHFGYGVPLAMIPPTIETSNLIRVIEQCVAESKDTLLEHYQVNISKDDLV